MSKKSFLFFLICVGVLFGAGWYLVHLRRAHSLPLNVTSTSRVVVTVSFYPLAEFAQHVGQDYVMVQNLTPPGVEPHDFEPTPQDLITIQNSRVFIYNGAGLEIWLSKLDPDVQQKVAMVNASQGIQLLYGGGEEKSPAPSNSHLPTSTTNTLQQDPHVWMDPVLAKQEVENIKTSLMKVDPAHAQAYQHNAAVYEQQLDELNQEFQTGLARCQIHDIVTSHNAFQYLGRRYGLSVLAISGLSPDEEPSAQKLAEAAQFVRQHQVHYIFFESLVSPKLSQTIAQETGAQTIAFNPLEGLTDQELAAGKNYISVQKDNLAALRTALQCQ